MIEATCSACGTVNRVAEADVPAGARFVNCTTCKARVVIAAAIPAVPALPKLPPRIPGKAPPIPGPAAALPVPPPLPGKKNDIIDLADLPAPKRQSVQTPVSSMPASSRPVDDSTGLPAPRGRESTPPKEMPLDLGPRQTGKRALTDLPVPPPEADDFEDLPAPKAADDGFDNLPAPKAAAGAFDNLPAPKAAAGAFDNLPAPKRGGGAFDDLPAPKRGGGGAFDDLPAPKRGGAFDNLPVPKRGGAFDNLPVPKSPGAFDNLPAPRRSGALDDLPEPRRGGPLDDLPEPAAGGGQNLPAPKGFFDDLPQPARPGAGANEIAPKGFFDDLPQPARPGAGANEVAPKGFFDDLPQPARAGAGASEVAPKGFFDDLPRPVDAPAPTRRSPIEQIELADDTGSLDLESPSAPQSSYGNIDLSVPSKGKKTAAAAEAATAGITFAATAKPATAAKRSGLPSLKHEQDPNATLELEDDGRQHVEPSAQLGPRTKQAPRVNEALVAHLRTKRRRRIGAVALVVLGLGGGGFYMYQRHAKAQARVDAISSELGNARKAMTADDANRWVRAAAAAGKVIEIEPTHGEALAISAEASIAGALADGKNATARIAKGRKQIGDALAASALTPQLDRAQALATLTSSPADATGKLTALIAKQPKDLSLPLYLGWAHHAAGDHAKAVAAFTTASGGTGIIKIQALLGRADSKLAMSDTAGAREDFQAVIALDKANIPAQVGIAAALPAAQLQQQESDLLAILARKDLASADPRAVSTAWVMAGDLARKGGRLDAARERYRNAIKIDARSIDAAIGLAETELRDNRIEEADTQIRKALVANKEHVIALLVSAEVMLRQAKLDDAAQRLDSLEHRQPPIVPLERARLLTVKGKLLELQRDDEGSVAAYIEAAKLSGDRDLSPTMLAVAKLTSMAEHTETPDKADALRARAEVLLGALAATAEQDPRTALALGSAYIQARQPAKAEPWIRRAAEARPEDPDAQYLLGRVLRAQNKGDEAIPQLEKAQQLAPDRAEIGLELARTLDLVGRNDDAGALFEKLLAADAPSLELRSHAGHFFVKIGQFKQAGEQGEALLAADHQYPAGHYLRGEGLLSSGQLEEARKAFLAAVDRERSAIHLDALGRATESIAMRKGKDYLAMQDAALRSYQAAIELEPRRFSSLLGTGRLYVTRREMDKAVKALLAANQLQSNDAEVAFLLGSAYHELGNKPAKKTAVEWLKKSLQLKQTADTAFRLGKIYTDPDINEGGPAISAFSLATKLAVENEKKTGQRPDWYPEALYQLGNLSNAVGDEGTACRAWKQYLGTSPRPGPRTEEVQRFLSTSLRGSC